jgi:N-acetylmuramoyl-L-alanine amidase
MRMLSRFLPPILMALIPAAALAAPTISGIRHWTAPDHTRIVLDLKGEFDYEISTRQGPERIVVDIPGAGFDCDTGARPVGDDLLSRVRCNRLRRGAQVVLDLGDAYRYKYFALDAIPGKKPRRIVIDVFPGRRGEPETPVVAAPAAEPKPVAVVTGPPAAREIVVVIDPGHGGEDPGAIHKGHREKIITLDIARRLKKQIDAMPGYRAVLTRKGDYFVSLARRRELADEARGDLLLSIHCNSAPNRNARGVRLYTLSTKGASSRRAQALADLENRADLVGGIHPKAGEEGIRLVLNRQLKTAIGRSREVAEVLRVAADRNQGLRASRSLKRAGFAVCKMVSMPSVLVEAGFFTNSHDFALLTSAEGRQRYARWLAQGVGDYFRGNPASLFDPLFARKDKLIYKVKRGDNLTRIAGRFNVSVEDIRRVNELRRGDHLGVGDLLLVVADENQPRVHKVKRGESLSRIAEQYGVSLDSLLRTNRIDRADFLRVGQELVILSDGERGG